MRKLTERVFARYGIDARLHASGEETAVKVLFWSVNSKSWQNMERRFGVLGQIPRGQYICLFPAGTAVEAEDYVSIGQWNYRICRVEDYLEAKGPVYRWALCTLRGSEDTWM